MTELPICPCDTFTHPQVLFNPPGRRAIAYRQGDYTSFRQALLLPLKDGDGHLIESELPNWTPGTDGDLAVQIVEWWAYLADILTFYNERVANESYLRTAELPESVQRLIRLLGYRPRPGIGASGIVAALVNNSKPFTLPQGFQIQSKPGPGKQPQIFELDVDTLVQSPDAIAAQPPANPQLLIRESVLLKGAITTIQTGERLLLLEKTWRGNDDRYALVTVQQIQLEKEPSGQTNTRVTFIDTSAFRSLRTAGALQYRLLRSNQSTHLWQHTANNSVVIHDHQVHLNSVTRLIKVGSPVLFEGPRQQSESNTELSSIQSFDSWVRADLTEPTARESYSTGRSLSNSVTQLFSVSQYAELIWYANGDPSSPSDPPPNPSPSNVPLIPILHTQLTCTPKFGEDWTSQTPKVIVHFDWQDVGQIIETPSPSLHDTNPKLVPARAVPFPANISQLSIQLEDANGDGITAEISAVSDLTTIQLNSPTSFTSLPSPLQILLNTLPISRGKTVPTEILGSGNASRAGQEFRLKKAPLTYLLSGDSNSGEHYTSTLRVWVDGIEWQEVSSFYGQPSDARIFVTREDETQQTIVQFGDGINGARLSTGIDNVVARYRYGSGKEAPEAGSLNVIVKPYPFLKAIRNPVAVGGGDDPEPAEQIRHYAPRSVLTFGRAVSGDDYEAIAVQTPGVSRAKVYWTWDAVQQRSLVKLYVGDDQNAVKAANIALSGAADPNRPVVVELAQSLTVQLTLTLQIAADRIPETVVAAAKKALIHPDTGLFGTNIVQIGQAIYQSQIYATCLQVPGVLAVHGLQFLFTTGTGFILDSHYRHDPGEGQFYQLLETNLTLNWEVG